MRGNNLLKFSIELLPKYILVIAVLVTVAVGLSKFMLAVVYSNIIAALNIEDAAKYILFGVTYLIVYAICYFTFFYLRQRIKLSAETSIQQKLLKDKNSIGFRDSEAQGGGSWSTLFLSDTDAVSDFIPNNALQIIKGLVGFISALCFGFWKSWLLTLFILIVSLASVVLPGILNKGIKSAKSNVQDADEILRGSLVSILNNIPIIRNYSADVRITSYFKKLCDSEANAKVENVKTTAKLYSLSSGLGFLFNAAWMVLGIFIMQKGLITVSIFAGFMTLSDSFNWPFFSLSYYLGNYAEQRASYDRLLAFEGQSNAHAANVCTEDGCGGTMGVVVDQVTYAYDESRTILNGMSFTVPEGQKLLLIGQNGIGKSTLFKIIMGLYDPASGAVRLSKDKSVYPTTPSAFSYMPQDSHLFTMTIRDNILLGNPSASTEQLAEAIRLADAQDFIQELEAGLDTLIGDNGYVKLSGGQAQRVALARALLKPGAVLMLDEFTSALDAHTEKRVLSNISKMPKRTIISISHKRLIKEYFDRIIRLNMQ